MTAAAIERAPRAAPVLLALLIGVLVAGAAVAQSAGGTYALTSHGVVGGGGKSSGAGLVLDSSIGQSDAGTLLVGATYQLTGGFQQAPASLGDGVFSHGFE